MFVMFGKLCTVAVFLCVSNTITSSLAVYARFDVTAQRRNDKNLVDVMTSNRKQAVFYVVLASENRVGKGGRRQVG